MALKRSHALLFGVLVIAMPAACSKKSPYPESKDFRVLGDLVRGAQDSFPRVRYSDSKRVSINDRCPVRKRRLDPAMPPVYVNGQPVGFCSPSCIATFLQSPERYLAGMKIEIKCVVDPSRPASVDGSHRAFVNEGVFFVSDAEALRAFVTEPFRYSGPVTDPVSLVRFQPEASSVVRSFGGRLFYFTSAATAITFDQAPAQYATPRPRPRKK